MRLRATILTFLLFSCVFCGFYRGARDDTAANTMLASTAYVDATIQRESGGNVVIKNTANSSVTLSQNPQTTSVQTSTNKEVATIGWTDENRTSKVRSGSENGTTLVNMWIE
jgi:hypothetical protein